MKTTFAIQCALLLASHARSHAAETAKPAGNPNVIIVLADDHRYGDLGISASRQIPTPHIVSLAPNGFRFVNADDYQVAVNPGKEPSILQTHDLTPCISNQTSILQHAA